MRDFSLRTYIEKLQEKSYDERKKYAKWVAALGTFLIFILWLIATL